MSARPCTPDRRLPLPCPASFRDGFCEWGDRCKYAHGEHELRILPAELMQRVDRLRSERDAAGLGRAPPRAPAPLNLRPAEPPPQMLALPAPGQPDAASDAAAGPSGALPPPPPLGADVDEETRRRQTREALRKTRLCDLFMSTGSCNFGNRCNFAHGYEELRAPMGVGGGPPMPPQPPPGMDMFG